MPNSLNVVKFVFVIFPYLLFKIINTVPIFLKINYLNNHLAQIKNKFECK
jgi:hypothetical protein